MSSSVTAMDKYIYSRGDIHSYLLNFKCFTGLDIRASFVNKYIPAN